MEITLATDGGVDISLQAPAFGDVIVSASSLDDALDTLAGVNNLFL